MTILLFLAVLFVLILVHEWGHYIVAKKTGMRVDEFGIGFPPKLFGYKKGETEYTLNLFPIGGFVRIYGENAADVAAADAAPDSFTSKSKTAQAAVLIAGVVMNIILAWCLFVVVLVMGIPTAVSESEAGESAQLRVQQILPNSPAEAADLPVGATISEVRTTDKTVSVPTPTSFKQLATGGDPLTITYSYAEEEYETVVTPVTSLETDAQSDEPLVGVGLSLIEVTSYSLPAALQQATVQTGVGLQNIVVGISGLIAQSVQGQADLSAVAGPVGIVSLVGDAASFGLTSLLLFTAIISLNLAVINMLPFPALDGGRLVFVAIEAVTRRPINPVWVMRLNTLGFILLLILMITITYSDITKLL